MTQEKFSDTITELDCDILDRYFLMKQSLTEKKKAQKRAFITWASLAACFALVATLGVMSGNTSTNPSAAAVINYGPFIFMPILLVSLISSCFSLAKRKNMLVLNAILWISVSCLNVLGVYLYSHFGGFNMMGHLPIILASSNIGIILSIAAITSLGRKPKAWWAKLLLVLLISVVSIMVSALAHNVILTLFSGDMFTIA